MSSNNMADPKRQNKILRYKPPSTEANPTLEDPTPDYMNLLGMIFSMCGLMLKLKWCAWIAVYCSFISFANSRSSEDTKQMMSSFISADISSSPVNVFRRSRMFRRSRTWRTTPGIVTQGRPPSRLSISAVVMSYLQNPQPMSPPW
ncbi:protein Asterix isoform X1 [Osmerus eperlanus]|uniref:protein Asterix isoform X1 n=1 Tax=Osmerus eperlanus TaxID=29151 RepID=UPI002E13465D